MVRFIENTVITIDVFLLLGSEIYLFWLIDWFDNSLVETPTLGFRILQQREIYSFDLAKNVSKSTAIFVTLLKSLWEKDLSKLLTK